jgi:alcohol dehydrogenase class IV
MIGAEYNTHHGLTNAIVLPVVLRFNLEGMDSQTATIAQNMHLEELSAAKLISEIEKLMGRTDIPDNLGEIGVPLDCVHRIAKKAMVDSATSTNPKKVSLMQMEDLVKTSIIGKRTT